MAMIICPKCGENIIVEKNWFKTIVIGWLFGGLGLIFIFPFIEIMLAFIIVEVFLCLWLLWRPIWKFKG